VIRYKWPLIRPLLVQLMQQHLHEFEAAEHVDVGPARPLPDNDSVDALCERFETLLEAFEGPPWTLQRLCELLLEPRKQYQRLHKLALALEKLLLVTGEQEVTPDPGPAPRLSQLTRVNEAPVSAAGSSGTAAAVGSKRQRQDEAEAGGLVAAALTVKQPPDAAQQQQQQQQQAVDDAAEGATHAAGKQAAAAAAAGAKAAADAEPAAMDVDSEGDASRNPSKAGNDIAAASEQAAAAPAAAVPAAAEAAAAGAPAGKDAAASDAGSSDAAAEAAVGDTKAAAS
jgi:serine/threonine-protein phosphatase 4 regulatory subunit 2